MNNWLTACVSRVVEARRTFQEIGSSLFSEALSILRSGREGAGDCGLRVFLSTLLPLARHTANLEQDSSREA